MTNRIASVIVGGPFILVEWVDRFNGSQAKMFRINDRVQTDVKQYFEENGLFVSTPTALCLPWLKKYEWLQG